MKDQDLNVPLKSKLIFGFSAIVLFMGSIGLISYFSLRYSIGKFNLMLETAITVNRIMDQAEETPKIIAQFYVEKKATDEQQVHNNLALMQKSVEL
jgi:hypothetical protein